MSVLDLRALLATLNEHGVRYVVIGGVAVGAHGYVRATEDLDIDADELVAYERRLLDAAQTRALRVASPGLQWRAAEPGH